jgi:deoxyribonuclease-4
MPKKKQFLMLGAHMSIAGGLEKAIERGESIGCTAIQLFTKSNRQWHAKDLTKEEIALFKKAKKKSPCVRSIVAHASYLINLCSPDSITNKKSVESLIQELHRCDQLEIPSLVLHPGSFVTQSESWALKKIIHNLEHIFDTFSGKTKLLLETMAGQGTTICSRFEQLAQIRSALTHKTKIGFCLDTCHIFAAGYDLRTPAAYEHTMHQFDSIAGLHHIHAIHVNDSKKELNSRIDRHEEIGEGQLGIDSFRLLFNDKRFFDVPKILETPKDDLPSYAHNMKILKNLLSEKNKKHFLAYSDVNQIAKSFEQKTDLPREHKQDIDKKEAK